MTSTQLRTWMGRHGLSAGQLAELREVLQRQAADEGARQGRTVSVSEWIRLLAEREQERQVRRERRAAAS